MKTKLLEIIHSEGHILYEADVFGHDHTVNAEKLADAILTLIRAEMPKELPGDFGELTIDSARELGWNKYRKTFLKILS